MKGFLTAVIAAAVAAICFGPGAAGAEPPEESPAVRRVNPGTVNDVAADTTPQTTQIGSSLVDLGDGRMVAAWTDSGSLTAGDHLTGYAWSANNGISWHDAGALANGATLDMSPKLAADLISKQVYFATFTGLDTTAKIQVSRSINGGQTFQPPVNATPGIVVDRWDTHSIAVDNSLPGARQGDVFVCATRSNGGVILTRSTNDGASFGPAGGVVISTTGIGCFLVVGPGHRLYVFYTIDHEYELERLAVRQSTDRGQTFGPEVIAADYVGQGYGDVGEIDEIDLNAVTPIDFVAQAAVNPGVAQGHVYVVYHDSYLPTHAEPDIYLTRSAPGGGSFGAPVRVNDDLSGDQFNPTIAFSDDGRHVLVTYYSRSQDPANLMHHRRGRLGTVSAGGSVTFSPSFQLSPSAPIANGRDPAYDYYYIGGYEQNAGGANAISTTWTDTRLGNAFHRNQHDIRFARIGIPPSVTDLAVTVLAPSPSITLGGTTSVTVRARATGGVANDVFVNLAPPPGLKIESVSHPSGQCILVYGFAGCSLGTVPANTAKSVHVVLRGIGTGGSRTFAATGSTSSVDYATLNNVGRATVTVAPGAPVTLQRSSGNISAAIPNPGTVDIPINVPSDGTVVDTVVGVRLNYSSATTDLDIALFSPSGRRIDLSSENRPGIGDENYGVGPNNCSGTLTRFSDSAPRSIHNALPPFDSPPYKPEQPLSRVAGEPARGIWRLRVRDADDFGSGVVGCFTLALKVVP